MGKQIKRESNIELLRIVTMLMIVMYHIIYHCVGEQLANASLLHEPVVYKKMIILVVLYTFGHIGNNMFILISGYFMANRGKRGGNRVNIAKTSSKLLTQLAFATLVLFVASFIAFYVSFKLNADVSFSVLQISRFNDSSWYIGYYFVVMLIGALFLNDFLSGLDEKQYLAFCLAGFGVISFGWSKTVVNSLASGALTLTTGLSLYSLGGFIRKFEPFKKVRSITFLLVIALMYCLVASSHLAGVSMEIRDFYLNGGEGSISHNIYIYGINSFVPIIIPICLFELFRRINIPYSRGINYLGASTLMVYLIHDNDFFRTIWKAKDWVTLLYESPARFVIHLCIWTFGAFACGVGVYALYLLTGKGLKKLKPLLLNRETEKAL